MPLAIIATAVITMLSSPIATSNNEEEIDPFINDPTPILAERVAAQPPPPPPAPTAPVQARTVSSSSGPVAYETWIAVARCESGYGGEPNWNLNTGNGFYGGLQFAISSWQWVGGTGYPHQASKDEQIHRANLLWQRQGWNAWPACSRKLGLR